MLAKYITFFIHTEYIDILYIQPLKNTRRKTTTSKQVGRASLKVLLLRLLVNIS